MNSIMQALFNSYSVLNNFMVEPFNKVNSKKIRQAMKLSNHIKATLNTPNNSGKN